MYLPHFFLQLESGLLKVRFRNGTSFLRKVRKKTALRTSLTKEKLYSATGYRMGRLIPAVARK